MHDFIAELSRHPLFRLMGALIVLLLADQSLPVGAAAAVFWLGWIWWGQQKANRNSDARPIFSQS